MENKYRILVADDSQNSREVMHKSLVSSEIEVDSVENGIEALCKIKEAIQSGNKYSLLITDIGMPEMRGDELIENIRKENIQIEILAVTGAGDKNLLIKLMRNNVSEYMDKPFRTSELKTRVAAIIEKSRKSAIEQKDNESNTKQYFLSTDSEKSTILTASGNITFEIADEFRSRLLSWFESGKGVLELDLQNTKDIDATCLSILVTLCTMVTNTKNDRSINLINVSMDVRNLISLTRLHKMVSIQV